MNFKKIFYVYKDYIIIFLISIIVYEFCYGLATLNPENINWLMSVYHDWGQHYLGWAYFRDEPWHFPLGTIENYNYPAGSNVGFTDSIPMLAIFFKIFSFILPEDFQYFGFWLLLCFFLNGVFSFKILKLYYKESNVVLLLSIIFIIVNPVLIFRGMHPALCGQWLILASIYNYLLKSKKENVLSINKNQLYLFLLSAVINPYLAAMVAGFNIIIPLKQYWYEKSLSLKRTIIFPVLSFASALVIWIILGLLEFGNGTNLDVGNIYGMYAFNLNSFFNSYGYYSRFIPDLGMVTDRQHEGFGYLGLGMIITSGIAVLYCLFLLIKDKGIIIRKKSLLPLFVLTLLYFLFAASNQVSWGKEIFFSYKTFGIIEKLGNIFRAIGRFAWPAYYMIFIFSLIAFAKIKINRYVKVCILSFLLGLQIYDIENIITSRDLKSGKFHTKLQDDKWLKILGQFDEIITYPIYTNNLVYNQDYQDLLFLALKAGKPITNGYAARENVDKLNIYKDTINSQLKKGVIFNNQVFITNRDGLKDFNSLFYKDKVSLKRQDNFYFIYSKDIAIKPSLFAEEKGIKLIDSIKNIMPRNDSFRLIDNNWATQENLNFNVESFSYEDDILNISGWAFNKSTKNGLKDSIFVALLGYEKSYLFLVNKVIRGDVSDSYKRKDLDESGFSVTVYTDKLSRINYAVGIIIKDSGGKYHLSNTDKVCGIAKKKYSTPIIIGKVPSSKPIISNLELIDKNEKVVKISGWATIENEDSSKNVIKIVLLSESKIYSFKTNMISRNDVTQSYKNTHNYDNSGFEFKFLVKDIPKGIYKIGVIVEDSIAKKTYYKEFRKKITL